MACLLNTYHRKQLAMRIVIDVSCIVTVAIGIFAIKFGVKPYHRGFFCDDETIKHPLLSDTITVPVAAVVGIFLPILMIIVIEILLSKDNKKFCVVSKKSVFSPKRSWMVAAYAYIVVFVFGLSVSQFLTEVSKVSIGRLRPHFLTLCAPDFSKLDCTKGFITDDVCTSTDTARLKEARLSFPSGHASFAMYCMMFCMLYLQARVSCKSTFLVKPLLLLILFSLGFYTCLSRISDYMHHWSDVLAGATLGVVVCICVVKGLTDLGPNLCAARLRDISKTGELSSLSNNNKTQVSSTSQFDNSATETHVVNIEDSAY